MHTFFFPSMIIQAAVKSLVFLHWLIYLKPFGSFLILIQAITEYDRCH